MGSSIDNARYKPELIDNSPTPMQTKLMTDFSPLWKDYEGQFILRYRDINETQQDRFASILKKKAPQYKINQETGPTRIEIKNLLLEINPIIFADGYRYQNHRDWGTQACEGLAGWRFKNLCQAVYSLLCVKKQKRSAKASTIERAAMTTILGVTPSICEEHDPWREIEGVMVPVNNWVGQARTPQQVREVTRTDITRAREQTQAREGRTTTATEMLLRNMHNLTREDPDRQRNYGYFPPLNNITPGFLADLDDGNGEPL